MARYKYIDTSPRFLAVDLHKQLIPGSFEYALNYLLDHEIDLSGFDIRYCNDETGACAYPPAMLLKVILFAYAQGMVSSRQMARACVEQVTFIALCGDSQPHFTTIAAFIARLADQIAPLFSQVLYVCDRQGLIGREMFAIDGVKLPSNASKLKSGTRADFEQQASKLEANARVMLSRHRAEDTRDIEPAIEAKAAKRITRLQQEAARLRTWLTAHPQDRKGSRGSVLQSNRTDGDSAKMATSKGVIQGYTGAAAVDARHQIIVEAQAHGTGSEQALLMPMLQSIQTAKTETPLIQPNSLITADAGYHSEANLKQLATMQVDALIADNGMRQRDERFKQQAKHKPVVSPLHDKSPQRAHLRKAAKHYQPQDFAYNAQTGTCICPAGKQLYQNGANCIHNGYRAIKFQGAQRDCLPCEQRTRCLRSPDKTKTRQVSFFQGKADTSQPSYTDLMKQRIDSDAGRAAYGRRFATVEPVFGNIRHNKQLNRFTLRGQKKVDTQWKLYCLIHNIEKLANYGKLEYKH